MLTQVQQANVCHISLEQSKTALKRTMELIVTSAPVLLNNSGSLITVIALLNYHASSSKAHDPLALFFLLHSTNEALWSLLFKYIPAIFMLTCYKKAGILSTCTQIARAEGYQQL